MVDFSREREKGKFPHSVTRSKLFSENVHVAKKSARKAFEKSRKKTQTQGSRDSFRL